MASENNGQRTALAGVRVVDLTQFEAGTSCTQLLAWMGAEVIKVEEPSKGDQGRRVTADNPTNDSPYFIALNSNKKSITANLKDERARALLWKLIDGADVMIENFAPGVIERLGFAYDAVKARNPRIIFAQIKGFPADGPYAKFLAFDGIAQAAGGSTSLTGEPDGLPLKPGVNIGDTGAGLHAGMGILAALYQRHATGVGQRVEVTMQEAVMNMGRSTYDRYNETHKEVVRLGNTNPNPNSPSGLYPCKGGGPMDYCYIIGRGAGGHDQQWEILLKLMERQDLIGDARYATLKARLQRSGEVDEIVSGWTRQHDKAHVMKLVGDAGLPCSAIYNPADLANDAFLKQRGSVVTVAHPVRGEVTFPGMPIRLSDSAVPIQCSPLLGADNQAVYGGMLGLSAEELAALKAAKAI